MPRARRSSARPKLNLDELARARSNAGEARACAPKRACCEHRCWQPLSEGAGRHQARSPRASPRSACLHPIAVTPDGRLIAGERRLLAFKHLGKAEIPVHVVDLEQIVRGEFAENSIARSLRRPSELHAIAERLKKLESRAREEAPRCSHRLGGKLPRCRISARPGDKVAEQLGVSGRNLDKIDYVMRAAETEPQRFGKYVEEMDATGKVDRAFVQVQPN